jgi:hypothetical protein
MQVFILVSDPVPELGHKVPPKRSPWNRRLRNPGMEKLLLSDQALMRSLSL